MDSVKIDVLKEQEIPAFIEFLRKFDFTSGDFEVFNWYRSLPTTTMIIAKKDGKVIGSGMSYGFGRTGWLGSIGVDGEYRRKGLGTVLTERAIDSLEKQGCESILLRASREGAPLYASMGFSITGSYENFFISPSILKVSLEDTYTVHPADKLDIQFISLDEEISGEDRSFALEHLPPSSGYEILREDKSIGVVYPSVGNGFLGLTEEPDLIPFLVSVMSNKRRFKVRTLVGSDGNRFLRNSGISPVDGAVRMVLGKDPLKKIRNVVGTISSSIG